MNLRNGEHKGLRGGEGKEHDENKVTIFKLSESKLKDKNLFSFLYKTF